MSIRVFLCSCQKCGKDFEFTGSYESFNVFMNSTKFSCPSGHEENGSPRGFLHVNVGDSKPINEWKPSESKRYVDILNYQTARINGMQIEHIGSGIYMDRRTRKKYDYEEDTKGERHYFEVA